MALSMKVSMARPAPLTVATRVVAKGPAPSARSASRVVRATMEQENSAMAAAEARWDAQLRDGVVKNVMAKDLKKMMTEGWTMLDVRPPTECKKVRVEDSVEVPLFVADDSLDPSALLKQMSAFGMGGWWLGGTHMVPNANFIGEVQQKVPKDAKVIVACQKGLRSLAACEQLSRAGFTDIAWVNGGFDNSRPGDVPTKGDEDIRLAGVGGVSSILGWTEVQQETGGAKGSAKSVLLLAGLLVVLDGAVFAYEQWSYMQGKTPF